MHVSEIYFYPIKSCQGTALTTAHIHKYGILGDRAYMVATPAGKFLTQREYPRMALIEPELHVDMLRLRAPGMAQLDVVRTPVGQRVTATIWRSTVDAADQGDEVAQWLSDFLGVSVRLLGMSNAFQRKLNPQYAPRESDETGFADGYPLLVISQAALDDLNQRLMEKGEAPVPMNRFRPNLVVAGCEAFAEDGWQQIQVNSVVFDVVKPCPRCPIPTIDQATGTRGHEPIKTLNTYRRTANGDVMFGQNLVHANRGTISVGDTVTVTAPVTAPASAPASSPKP